MNGAQARARRKSGDEPGFTLIETILTLAILSAMLVIVFSALRIGLMSWEKGEAAARDGSAIRTITSKLAKEIGSAYPYKDNIDGNVTVLFTGGSKELGFVTAAPGISGLPWGGAKWVYYSLRGDVLTVREKTVPSAGTLHDWGGRLTELDRGVDTLSFEYLGEDGWEKSWDVRDKETLPSSIRVNISFRDGKKAVSVPVMVELSGLRRKETAAAPET